MTRELIEHERKHHELADFALIVTTIALVVSLVIAATVVSIGIARADTLVPIAESGVGRFALVLVVGFVIACMGGLTAAMVQNEKYSPRRD